MTIPGITTPVAGYASGGPTSAAQSGSSATAGNAADAANPAASRDRFKNDLKALFDAVKQGDMGAAQDALT
jgi:hypothetical protein